jgi:hypothetical protein
VPQYGSARVASGGRPAIRWHRLRDLGGAFTAQVEHEQRTVAREGWGAQLLALGDAAGLWAGGLYTPKWTSTTEMLLPRRDFGLEPGNVQAVASTTTGESISSRGRGVRRRGRRGKAAPVRVPRTLWGTAAETGKLLRNPLNLVVFHREHTLLLPLPARAEHPSAPGPPGPVRFGVACGLPARCQACCPPRSLGRLSPNAPV